MPLFRRGAVAATDKIEGVSIEDSQSPGEEWQRNILCDCIVHFSKAIPYAPLQIHVSCTCVCAGAEMDNIVWTRYPYYEERHEHNARQKRPPPPNAAQIDGSDKERKALDDMTVVRAAYIEYQLLWDDFISALRDARGQRARNGYTAPPIVGAPATTEARLKERLEAAEKALHEAQTGRTVAASKMANAQKADEPAAARALLEAQDKLRRVTAAYEAAERALEELPEKQLFAERWVALQGIVAELARNAYVRAKNAQASLPEEAYVQSLLAMVFDRRK